MSKGFVVVDKNQNRNIILSHLSTYILLKNVAVAHREVNLNTVLSIVKLLKNGRDQHQVSVL